MLSTKTNLEITEYHEKFFLGLSLRQLACFGVAAVLAIATCFVCLQWLHLDIQLVSYIVMIEVLPFLGLGFISHNGYPFEKLVKIYWAWYCGPAEVAVCPRQEKNYVFTKKARRHAHRTECVGVFARTGEIVKTRKKKAAKERRQRAKQLKKDEKHAKKRIAARKVPQKASDCLQYLSMSQDGICEIEPCLFSMTMAFTDVNFQIAMLEEQKNIFTKYSEFLNYFDPSLHLEINLVTRSMDEEQFRRDTFLPLHGDDRDRYAEEMNQVVAEKALRGQNGLIREKYVTFSLHAENYQQAKEQLENRAADIADHFKRMGSSTRLLSGIERLSLLQGIMRPNEEMSFSYDWLLAEDDLTTKDFISPSSYNWHPEHDDSRAVYRDRYQFGDKIGKTMYLRGIAPEMKNGLFSMLSELPFDHVITMHVDAMDQAEAVQEIEKKLAYMHKEEYDAIAKARERNMPASIAVSYDLKSKMHHTEQMMDDITTRNQKIFKVCILIHTYGGTNAQLDERVRRICSTVQQQTCRFDSILYEQRNAMNSMLPLGKKWLGLERTLETVSTAIYVPFTTQELFQPGGLYEGINARSKNLILCNRKLLPAPAGMVLGMTGYGKSFSVMQMVSSIMLRWPDDDIVLIDPEQEYTHLVTAMGGVVIDISASSPSHINPMDITEDYGDDEDPHPTEKPVLAKFLPADPAQLRIVAPGANLY